MHKTIYSSTQDFKPESYHVNQLGWGSKGREEERVQAQSSFWLADCKQEIFFEEQFIDMEIFYYFFY